ncbi:MAG: DegV family protein [Actinomycetota bacterium]|nr:DegV family protein [Actinomycetota bacterium]
MAGIGIVTDSTAYLDDEYCDRNGIRVVPLKIIMEDVSYREGIDINHDDFYRRLKEPGVFPTTSQPSSGEFLEAYKDMANSYDSLLSVHISKGISGTIESARTAAAEIGDFPIELIDSRVTGVALALLIDELVKARDQGVDMEGLLSVSERIIKGMELMFVVDTLEYLHRGGRIGGAQALMGSMLRIKPILHIDGTIDALDKVRGSKKALDRLVDIAVEKLGSRKARVGFTHVRNTEKMRELQKKAARVLDFGPDEVIVNETGPVIGSHVGPGTTGICFFPKE